MSTSVYDALNAEIKKLYNTQLNESLENMRNNLKDIGEKIRFAERNNMITSTQLHDLLESVQPIRIKCSKKLSNDEDLKLVEELKKRYGEM